MGAPGRNASWGFFFFINKIAIINVAIISLPQPRAKAGDGENPFPMNHFLFSFPRIRLRGFFIVRK